MALLNTNQVVMLVDSFVDNLLNQIREVEDKRLRNQLLMAARRRLYQDIYKRIDPRLGGGRGTGEDEEEILELWNNHELLTVQEIGDMFARSKQSVSLVLSKFRKQEREVLGPNERLRRRRYTQNQLHPRTAGQKKKPRVMECTDCTYRWVEYYTQQQWENWQAQTLQAACRRCKKVGTITAF